MIAGATLTLLGVIALVSIVSMVSAVLVAKNLIYICGPNEVLIFSGGTHKGVRGRPRGYRVIKGGRGLRIPLFEAVDRVDLTNMIIDVSVTNAYSMGGIPLTVSGVANVKVSGHDPALGNALERFLVKDRNSLIRIAKDTLEGNLRGVLSQLTPEEVNNDKIRFAEKLLEEAEHDLGKLGLTLDTLKIQNVADDVGYLDSIGRVQSAEVIKRARIAEAEAKAISIQREAENNQTARLAAIEAEMAVVRAETQRRIKDAQTRKIAMMAEEVGAVKALMARARADLRTQEARVEQVQRQLQADVLEPARATMKAGISSAKGNAATITEDGKATVAVLEEMIATWQSGGENARDIFLMQKLQTLMESLVSTIDDVTIDQITVLPDGETSGSTGAKAARLVEELKGSVGVDIPALLLQHAVSKDS
jgi:flotillin